MENEEMTREEEIGTVVDNENINEESVGLPVEAESTDMVADETTDVVEDPVTVVLPKRSIKDLPKKTKAIIGGGVLTVVALIIILSALVIRPMNVYKDAVAALEAKDFTECQRLIDKIPNYSKTSQLRTELTYAQAENYVDNKMLDEAEALLVSIANYSKTKTLKDEIVYKRAALAIADEDYGKAEEYLAEIPDHSDPDGLNNKLKYNQALQLLEGGNYVDAYGMFEELGDYEDSKAQLDKVYYEAFALMYLLKHQPSLKNPSSLRVSEVTFYESEDDYILIVEYTGTNSYGGTVGSYLYAILYDEDESYFTISHSDYADPEDFSDQLYACVIASTISDDTDMGVEVDITRMNRLFENKVEFKVDLEFTQEEITEN